MDASLAFKKLQPEDFYKAHIDQGVRPDGRGSLTASRPVSISVGSIGTADGSAIVKQGETSVVCGVKLELAEPRPEAPDQGFVVPNLELSPICHPQFKPGPPSELAQTVSNFLLEVVENSELISVIDLCIEPGKLVWAVYIDLTCLNFGGNILDVCLKAIVAALKNTTIPKVEVVVKEDAAAAESDEIQVDCEDRSKLKLSSTRGEPVACSIAVFDQDKLLVDPTEDEEQLASGGVVTVVMQLPPSLEEGSQPEICHIHKPIGGAISREVLQKCCSLAKKQCRHIKKLIDTASSVPKLTSK